MFVGVWLTEFQFVILHLLCTPAVKRPPRREHILILSVRPLLEHVALPLPQLLLLFFSLAAFVVSSRLAPAFFVTLSFRNTLASLMGRSPCALDLREADLVYI